MRLSKPASSSVPNCCCTQMLSHNPIDVIADLRSTFTKLFLCCVLLLFWFIHLTSNVKLSNRNFFIKFFLCSLKEPDFISFLYMREPFITKLFASFVFVYLQYSSMYVRTLNWDAWVRKKWHKVVMVVWSSRSMGVPIEHVLRWVVSFSPFVWLSAIIWLIVLHWSWNKKRKPISRYV